MSHYQSGAAFERRVRDVLGERGYFCVRSPRSGGPVDVLAVARRGTPPPRVLLVQCKADKRREFPPDEWNALFSLAVELDAEAVLAAKEARKLCFYRLIAEKSGVKGVRSPMEPLWPGVLGEAKTVTELVLRCLLCEGREEEGPDEYMAHVRECHSDLLDADGRLIAEQLGRTHYDWPDRYQNTYIWQKDGVKICVKTVSGTRGADDPMRDAP